MGALKTSQEDETDDKTTYNNNSDDVDYKMLKLKPDFEGEIVFALHSYYSSFLCVSLLPKQYLFLRLQNEGKY
jgi:hypothetical protein